MMAGSSTLGHLLLFLGCLVPISQIQGGSRLETLRALNLRLRTLMTLRQFFVLKKLAPVLLTLSILFNESHHC